MYKNDKVRIPQRSRCYREASITYLSCLGSPNMPQISLHWADCGRPDQLRGRISEMATEHKNNRILPYLVIPHLLMFSLTRKSRLDENHTHRERVRKKSTSAVIAVPQEIVEYTQPRAYTTTHFYTDNYLFTMAQHGGKGGGGSGYTAIYSILLCPRQRYSEKGGVLLLGRRMSEM